MPTIHDVARHANVGVSTVSKVLNGYSDIADETRERVLASVEELNYTPNRAARSFRTGKTRTASVFLPMIGTLFYDRLITAIDGELAAHDYDAALFPLLNEQRLNRYREADALPYHADGVIFSSLNPEWLFENAKLPVVLPAVLVDAYHADFDTITVDNSGGAFEATTHLLQGIGPTFGVMLEKHDDTPFASGVFIERHKGFRKAFEATGKTFSEDTVLSVAFSRGGGREALRRILERSSPPVNVFVSCDLVARGAMDEAADRGLELGRDVRLVGFDDQPWTEELGLSTVHQPIEQMGARAAQLLLRRLDDPNAEVIHEEVVPRLIRRASS